MDSPSRSSRSWNTLPLNNELNLSSASGGDLGATLSLAQSFVDRARTLTQTSARAHTRGAAIIFIFFLPQVALQEILCWLAVKKEKNRAGRHRRSAAASERQQGWRGCWRFLSSGFSSGLTRPAPLGFRRKCFNRESKDRSEKKGWACDEVRWKSQPLDTGLMNGRASHPWLRFKRCGWEELKGVSSTDESADLSESPSPQSLPREAH